MKSVKRGCVLAVLFVVVSCKKGTPTQGTPNPNIAMEYINLYDRDILANAPGYAIDVNHDGRKDLHFVTQLVGDPVAQVDKVQFLVSSNINVMLPVNSNEEIPVMNSGETIVLDSFNGYQWFDLSSIILVQKIISFTEPDKWEGHWKEARHKFIPYQVVIAGKRYNGWVEISVDITNEKLVLHKAAICKNPETIVKAGI